MPTKPRVIFWGSPDFALPPLRACLEHAQVLGVVSQPDKERGRGHEMLPTPVKALALTKGLPVFTPKSLRKESPERDELFAFLEKNSADFFVVVAYGNLLPDSVLAMPKVAPLNIHASLLPQWRGAAPIQRSLEAGEVVTGVSLQRMVQELDAGDIYLEKKLSVTDDDNAKTLFEKLSVLGAELIGEFLQTPFSKLSAKPQDKSRVTLAPKIDKREALWSATWSSREFHNRVRAFWLWPTVKMIFENPQGQRLEIKVLKTQLGNGAWSEDEAWKFVDRKVHVRGSDRRDVILDIVQVPGKGPGPADAAFQKLQKDSFRLISQS